MAPTVVADTGGYVLETNPPKPGVFEIALVMAGAVSAGAYTAGVLDYLIEALDAWQAEKEKRRAQNPDPRAWDIPGHDVVLRVVSGASAGSMCGAIASVAFKHSFPHVHASGGGASNPLYKPWVLDIDISKLLQTRDLQDKKAPVVSLFDSTSLLEILQGAIDFQGPALVDRQWINGGVRFIFMQSNLRGIPYFLQLTGGTGGLAMICHADYQSFSVSYNLTGQLVPKADDARVGFPNNFTDPAWHKLGVAAVASGAFPVGLAPRVIVRNAGEFAYRFVVIPGIGPSTSTAVQLTPRFNGPPPPDYRTVVVDGGTMNNEPLELARIELAGLAGRNEREGKLANRATLMIDPFPDEAATVDDPNRGQKDDLIGAGIGLLNAWKDQARFAPLDLALATDKSVYSRYMIAPSRGANDPASNGFAIACGALGGFSGFLSEKFRDHDFLLGRRNCQMFLRKHFALPVDNQPVFAVVNPALKQPGSPWIIDDPQLGPHLPLIPIMPAVAPAEPLPIWPKGAMQPEALRKPMSKRIGLVLENVLRNTVQLNFFLRIIAEIGLMSIRKKAVDKAIEIVGNALKERNLL